MKNGYTKSCPVIYKSGGYPVQPCLEASMGTVKFYPVITIASDLTIAILTNHTTFNRCFRGIHGKFTHEFIHPVITIATLQVP